MPDGTTFQQDEERIDVREVKIVNGVLKLNGRPIKLRGVNHHGIDSINGHAVTEESMRTSHYRPHPHFIEFCDEIGVC